MLSRRKSRSSKRSRSHSSSRPRRIGGAAKKAAKKKGTKKASSKSGKKSGKKASSKQSDGPALSNEENDKRCAQYNGKSKDCRSNKCWYDYNKETCTGLRRRDEM